MIGEFEPSERGSAINTLPANQNAPYRVVPAEFRRQTPAYEVVLLRKHEAYTAFGKKISAGECYPSSEQWGVKGFTYRTIEAAECKFRELTVNAKGVA